MKNINKKIVLPQTTEKEPYIDFSFDASNDLYLKSCCFFWGGKNSGYTSTSGRKGNSCLPKYFNSYLKAFIQNEIKIREKNILVLQKELELFKNATSNFIKPRNKKDEPNNWGGC